MSLNLQQRKLTQIADRIRNGASQLIVAEISTSIFKRLSEKIQRIVLGRASSTLSLAIQRKKCHSSVHFQKLLQVADRIRNGASQLIEVEIPARV
jgi:hypothetical protein